MRLRDFLGTATSLGFDGLTLNPSIPEEACVRQVERQRSPFSPTLVRGAPAGFVWVDCYFYGFFMEEEMARQAGLHPDMLAAKSVLAPPHAAVAAC